MHPEQAILHVSYSAAHLSEPGEYRLACLETLQELLPSDSLGFIEYDVDVGRVHVWGTGDSARAEIGDALSHHPDRHPVLASLTERPYDPSPRRISDLLSLRDWRRHEVYNEVFVPLGATYHVSLPLTFGQSEAPGNRWGGIGWGFNRANHDFSDDEVALLFSLRRLLRAMEQQSQIRSLPSFSPRVIEESELSPREEQILVAVSQGLTAVAIGHVHRISARTVNKHLENAYRKLGVRDRISALNRLRTSTPGVSASEPPRSSTLSYSLLSNINSTPAPRGVR